jgi:hypothetical protein
MYRTVSVEEHPGYSLAFIEFDDQGELWAPSQLDRALNHLERLNQSEDGIALVLFVHGWNADASPREEKEGPGTVYRFRALLDRLDRGIRREVPDREPRLERPGLLRSARARGLLLQPPGRRRAHCRRAHHRGDLPHPHRRP